MSIRKGPEDSATLYKPGTIMKGNDGNLWIIMSNKNKIHKWIPYIKINKNYYYYKNNLLFKIEYNKDINVKQINIKTLFDFYNKKMDIKKIGELDINTNKIGVGEFLYKIYPCKKGQWNIYKLDGSLIAIHETIKIETALNKTLNDCGTVLCDGGMFAFNDPSRIKLEINNKIKGKYLNFPDLNNFKKFDYRGDIYNIIDKNNNEKVAIFSGNGSGDGAFYLLCGKDIFLILSMNILDLIYQFYENIIKK